MDIEMSINPEILDVVEASTLENMKGLFGDLRDALRIMQTVQENDGAVCAEIEEDFDAIVERANEKLAGMKEAFEIFECVFGCAFGVSEEYEYDGDEDDETWVDELTPAPVDDFDRDPETGEMYDPETE